MNRSKRKRVTPYKLRDFHIELTDFRHRIRGDPERETDTDESSQLQLTDQYRARSHTQIREELLYNFDKETVAREDQLDVQKKLLLNGTGDYVTRVEQSSSYHRLAIEEEDTKPVKMTPASPCRDKDSSVKLPGDWRSLEIHELATEVEACGVDPVIVEEHLIQNHDNVAKKIKSEKKSIVLPRDRRDKIRDELIEDLCSDNKLDKGLLDSELQLQQSDQVPSSPIKLKLPAEWRTMTRETLAENCGIMLEGRNPD